MSRTKVDSRVGSLAGAGTADTVHCPVTSHSTATRPPGGIRSFLVKRLPHAPDRDRRPHQRQPGESQRPRHR